MALKGDRDILATEISYFMNETASRGVTVSVSNTGSGVALDNVNNIATVAAIASGSRPIGCLLQDVVNIDLTKQPLNWLKDQANSGDKVTIVRKGWLVTDQIIGTVTAQDTAVLHNAGSVSGQTPGNVWDETRFPRVGRFLSKKDQAGFAKVFWDL